MQFRNLIVLLAILLCAMTAVAQANAPKPEDALCTLSGTVLAADSGKPLKSAQVRLDEAGSKSPHSYHTSTDNEGKFLIKSVVPSRYHFVATKTGYVRQQYRPENSVGSSMLTLAPAQNLDRIIFRMTPAAVLAGRITDEDGEPISGVAVTAMIKARPDMGMGWGGESRKQLIPVAQAATNDLGEYRLFGLHPGKYYVAAIDAGEDSVFFTPDDGSGVNGRPVRRYPPTFYPGTMIASQAEQLQVKATEEVRVDFTLQPIKLFEIKGKVVAGNGEPGGAAWITLHQPESIMQEWITQNYSSVDSSGSFTITGVSPGSYEIIGNSNDRERQIAVRQKVEVTDHDITDLRLVLTRGVVVTGSVLTEQGQPLPGNLRQYLLLAGGENEWNANNGDQVKADGSFSIAAMRPGEYRVHVVQMPEGWYVKSARFGDQDVTDSKLKIESTTGTVSLDVRVANDAGRLEGAVQLNDKPAPGATVLLHRDHDPDDQVQSIRADQNGNYVAKNLRPGGYHVLAFQKDEDDWESDLPETAEIEKNGESMEMSSKATKSLLLKMKTKPDQTSANEPRQ